MQTPKLALLLALLPAACSNPRSGPGAGAADSMGGMAMGDSSGRSPAGPLTLSPAQIQHGGIRWEAVAIGPASDAILASNPLPGQIVPNEDRTARLGAPAGGRVLTVRVNPGDRVRAGQVLVTLQSPEAGMAQSELAKATAAVTSRRAQAAYAASARRRADRLLALKAISRQEYERAVADDELAQGDVSQAEAEQERARSTAHSLGAVGMPSGQLAVRSPLAGVVLERTAVPGTVVAAGAPLAVVTDPSTLWVTLNAPESDLASLRVGASLRFVVPAYPADTFSARLTAVGAGLDPDTRTVFARAEVSNPGGRLKPAMLASVVLPAPPRSSAPGTAAIVLPAEAVQMLDGLPVVFGVSPSPDGGARFVARRVEIGSRFGHQVIIAGGLTPGERVVVAGAFAVKAELTKSRIHKMEM